MNDLHEATIGGIPCLAMLYAGVEVIDASTCKTRVVVNEHGELEYEPLMSRLAAHSSAHGKAIFGPFSSKEEQDWIADYERLNGWFTSGDQIEYEGPVCASSAGGKSARGRGSVILTSVSMNCAWIGESTIDVKVEAVGPVTRIDDETA